MAITGLGSILKSAIFYLAGVYLLRTSKMPYSQPRSIVSAQRGTVECGVPPPSALHPLTCPDITLEESSFALLDTF